MTTRPLTRSSHTTGLAVLCAFALAVWPNRGWACATCGCGDLTLTAMGVEKPYDGRIRLALDERFGAATTGAPPGVELSRTLRSSLAISWSPTARITLGALVPVLSIWDQVLPGPWQGFTGLGDAELSARAVVWRDRSFSPSKLITLLGGLKTPTGPLVYDGKVPFTDDIQPGSGSWDPFAGLTLQWFRPPFSALASVSYRFTTSDLRGDAVVHGYRHGQSIGGTLGAQMQPWKYVALALFADLNWATHDTVPGGAGDPDSGGAVVAVTPSVALAPATNWLLRMALQMPVVEALNGQQWQSPTVIFSTVVDLN